MLMLTALFTYCFLQLTAGMSVGDFTQGSKREAREVLTPIDCKMTSWSVWAPCDPCTKTMHRSRGIELFGQFGGQKCIEPIGEKKPCQPTTQCVEDPLPVCTTNEFLCESEMSQKQKTSSMAVAGAVMGAVLALFLITIFTIVLLTARKARSHTHTDKVIDLPPTHRPPPPYSGRPLAVPQDPLTVASFSQPYRMDKCQVDRMPGRMTHCELQNPTHHPLSYQEWICHQNGDDRVYINHREHYV